MLSCVFKKAAGGPAITFAFHTGKQREEEDKRLSLLDVRLLQGAFLKSPSPIAAYVFHWPAICLCEFSLCSGINVSCNVKELEKEAG